ncbi:MAG TPA: hypothetical protein VN083_01450 [Vicinamibacteria bacterium]|jgi:hypothetical protein|nr:hypothetical protein [Vicinamibacteria bacterium]
MATLWTATTALAATFTGVSRLAGERPSQVLLVLGAIVALGLSRAPRRP